MMYKGVEFSMFSSMVMISSAPPPPPPPPPLPSYPSFLLKYTLRFLIELYGANTNCHCQHYVLNPRPHLYSLIHYTKNILRAGNL